jgi:hypothetical protein
MSMLHILLLPLTIPSWIGCRTSDAMAASVDGVVRLGESARRHLGWGEPSPRDGA